MVQLPKEIKLLYNNINHFKGLTQAFFLGDVMGSPLLWSFFSSTML